MAEESAAAVVEAPVGTETGVVETEGVASSGSVESPPIPSPAPDAAPSAPERLTPQPVQRREPVPEREPARQPPRQSQPQTEPEPAKPAQEADSLLDWHEMIPPDVRKEPIWNKFKDVGEALKSLVNQEKLIGEMIRLPRDGASDAQMRAFYERLGCPKLAADYVMTDPDMGQDEAGTARTLAPDFLTSLLEVGHQAGLTNSQMQHFVDFAARTVVRSENIQAGEMAQMRGQAERDLYDAFGGDAPAMVEKARMFIINMGSGRYGGGAYAERAAEKLKSSVLANDIDMIATLANGWDNFREGIWVGDEVGGSLSSMEQINADIQALGVVMNDDSKPMDERQAAQRKQFALYQQMNEIQEANSRRQQTQRR